MPFGLFWSLLHCSCHKPSVLRIACRYRTSLYLASVWRLLIGLLHAFLRFELCRPGMLVRLFFLWPCRRGQLSRPQHLSVFHQISSGKLGRCGIRPIPCEWEFGKSLFSPHEIPEPIAADLKKYLGLFRRQEFLPFKFLFSVLLGFVRVGFPPDSRASDQEGFWFFLG